MIGARCGKGYCQVGAVGRVVGQWQCCVRRYHNSPPAVINGCISGRVCLVESVAIVVIVRVTGGTARSVLIEVEGMVASIRRYEAHSKVLPWLIRVILAGDGSRQCFVLKAILIKFIAPS